MEGLVGRFLHAKRWLQITTLILTAQAASIKLDLRHLLAELQGVLQGVGKYSLVCSLSDRTTSAGTSAAVPSEIDLHADQLSSVPTSTGEPSSGLTDSTDAQGRPPGTAAALQRFLSGTTALLKHDQLCVARSSRGQRVQGCKASMASRSSEPSRRGKEQRNGITCSGSCTSMAHCQRQHPSSVRQCLEISAHQSCASWWRTSARSTRAEASSLTTYSGPWRLPS